MKSLDNLVYICSFRYWSNSDFYQPSRLDSHKMLKIFAKIDLDFWQRLFSILQFQDKGFINQRVTGLIL